MLIIGCDFHPGFQQVAIFDNRTGEMQEKQLQARTRSKNQLQAMALSCGVQKKRKLWSKAGRAELEQLPLLPYAAERRKRLLEALDGLEVEIVELDRRVEEEARSDRRQCD